MEKKKSQIKFYLDLEIIVPLLDLLVSLIFRKIKGPSNIDFRSYIQQTDTYLDDVDGADYTKLHGECGPIAYPGASVYFYAIVNLISGRNANINFAQDFHIPVDVFRMWMLVKVYKLAFGERIMKERKLYVFALLLFQGKYKFIGVVHTFNDVIM